MRLFVDDTRTFPKSGYQCCRDSKTAIAFLSFMKFEFITLDYSLSGGDTGMDILIWMKENGVSVPAVNIHSNNVEGRRIMQHYCEENFPETKLTMNMLPK
ncbi:MAG: hypothetical protein J6S13_09475 [Clostridia bacterium]|nr:hypothetical protein [Clostridia bacterium]